MSLELPKFLRSEPGKIVVSESFLSIQGEGRTQGTLSVFLRVSGCNLLCSWNNKITLGREPCDTIPVWSTGKVYKIEELIDEWEKKGWLKKLSDGAHLIVTGGEPLLRQNEIVDLLNALDGNVQYVEVETNGTIKPLSSFDDWVYQYNVSPKLVSSNMPRNVRYNEKVLDWFAKAQPDEGILGKSIFKFVITQPEDMEEIWFDYVKKFSIPKENVYLMPLADNRNELIKNSKMCADLAMEYGVNYSCRLQILIWEKTTGV